MDLRGVHDWYLGLQKHILTTPALAPLHQVFKDAPFSNDFKEVRDFHDRIISRAVFNDGLNDAIMVAINDFAAKHYRVGLDKRKTEEDPRDYLDTLLERGWVELPSFDEERCDAIQKDLKSLNVYEGFTKEQEAPMKVDEARGRFNIANYKDTHVILKPEPLRFATDPLATAVARLYLNVPPILSTLSCWWSFSGHDAIHAQLYHLDLDCYRFVKQFVYLTDVGPENGPHAFVEQTQKTSYIEDAMRNCPDGEDTFVEWYMKSMRKSDEDVARYFPQPTTFITGKRGTRFLALTRAIHKGLAPVEGERLLMQSTYCATPYVQRQPAPRKMSDPAARRLPRDCLRPPMDYTLQLYLER